ncbi:MAG: hypothetical protein ACLTDR_04730 [Adlercreutzia equolifaciens]
MGTLFRKHRSRALSSRGRACSSGLWPSPFILGDIFVFARLRYELGRRHGVRPRAHRRGGPMRREGRVAVFSGGGARWGKGRRSVAGRAPLRRWERPHRPSSERRGDGVFSVDEDGEPLCPLAPGLQIGGRRPDCWRHRSQHPGIRWWAPGARRRALMTSIAPREPGAFADPGRLEAMFSAIDATEEVSSPAAPKGVGALLLRCSRAWQPLFGAQIAVDGRLLDPAEPLAVGRAAGAGGHRAHAHASGDASGLLAAVVLLPAHRVSVHALLSWGRLRAGREGHCARGGTGRRIAARLPTPWARRSRIALRSWTWRSKTGILTGVVCLLSLFTGLYGEPCMELADMVSREFPVLASLNPAKAICDMFYSLYYLRRAGGVRGERGARRPLFSAVRCSPWGAVREEAALCASL